MMKPIVKYKKRGKQKAQFVIDGIDFIWANTIRRAIMTYVPSMAVERVRIYENTSPIYDEILVKRIGLVPLFTDLKTYNLPQECKCGGKGCARCQVTLILEKSGPGMVYSGDLKAQDPKIKPVYDKIPLVKLGKGQKVKMEMIAQLGLMSDHAKYQPALASYKQLTETKFEFFVESYNNLTPEEIIECAMDRLGTKFDTQI